VLVVVVVASVVVERVGVDGVVVSMSVVAVVVVLVLVGWYWVLRVCGVQWWGGCLRWWWLCVALCCVVFWIFCSLVCGCCGRSCFVVGVWVFSVVLEIFFWWFSLVVSCRAVT
jgi:hypothetical protein